MVHSKNPGAGATARGAGDVDAGKRLIPSPNEPGVQRGRLIDRYGHEHSEAIFRNWTPQAIRVLGIRRVDDGGARCHRTKAELELEQLARKRLERTPPSRFFPTPTDKEEEENVTDK